ncbi:MAG: hypothetical protein GKS05_07635 [Nitrospirales bacterium]|nr:hypothetical protein [Nitrospirales bacterium]
MQRQNFQPSASTAQPFTQTEMSAEHHEDQQERPSKPFLCRRPVRITIYAGFIGLVLFMLMWGYLPVFLDPTFEKHIEDKQVVVGMTRKQAMASWGSPIQMNVSYTDRGVRREEWVYEDWEGPGIVSHRYLYFEEGTLVGGWYYE